LEKDAMVNFTSTVFSLRTIGKDGMKSIKKTGWKLQVCQPWLKLGNIVMWAYVLLLLTACSWKKWQLMEKQFH